jgi:hypothetical protein
MAAASKSNVQRNGGERDKDTFGTEQDEGCSDERNRQRIEEHGSEGAAKSIPSIPSFA